MKWSLNSMLPLLCFVYFLLSKLKLVYKEKLLIHEINDGNWFLYDCMYIYYVPIETKDNFVTLS